MGAGTVAQGVSSVSEPSSPCFHRIYKPKFDEEDVSSLSPEERRRRAERVVAAATWSDDVTELERAVEAARAAGVAGSTLTVAEMVLSRQLTRASAELELASAMRLKDTTQLKTALTLARERGVAPSRVNAADQ